MKVRSMDPAGEHNSAKSLIVVSLDKNCVAVGLHQVLSFVLSQLECVRLVPQDENRRLTLASRDLTESGYVDIGLAVKSSVLRHGAMLRCSVGSWPGRV